MKKVFLDDLPRFNNNIDWENSIGCIVDFVYYNVKGKFHIIRYNNKDRKLQILFNNNIFDILTSGLIGANIGKIIGQKTSDFKLQINTNLKDEKRNITITNRTKIQNKNGQIRKYYKYKCNKCGYDCGEHWNIKDKKYKNELWVEESHIYGKNRNDGCACCGGNSIVVENINSIYYTDTWMIPIIGEENAKIHRHASTDKVEVTCPNCGRIKKQHTRIVDIYKSHSIGCSCSDSISFGEKLMFSFLEQLNIKFFTQLNKNILKWCKNYRYDFYFELNNEQYIIETHGEQHYEEGFQKMKSKRKSKTLEEEQKNDRLKKELALQNGIKEENYIVIDCRKSTLEWIRDNDNGILNSILSELFDLSKIDWDKVEEFALSNLIKIASEYKNNNPNTTTGMIGELMGYNYHTISNWLKQGTKLGWCNYNPKEEQRRIGKKNGKLSSIRQNQLLIHNENLVQTI